MIEVLSPSTSRYDKVTKRACYARNGVPEYWIVNPDEHVVEQLVLEGAEYRLREACGERIAPHAPPGVAVDLTRVW